MTTSPPDLADLSTTGLDPASYTAERLSHAYPEHLHATSRRLFIGPIPRGWLDSHRRQFYREKFNIPYSSRAVTFTAQDWVSNVRRVSGLETGREGKKNNNDGSTIHNNTGEPDTGGVEREVEGNAKDPVEDSGDRYASTEDNVQQGGGDEESSKAAKSERDETLEPYPTQPGGPSSRPGDLNVRHSLKLSSLSPQQSPRTIEQQYEPQIESSGGRGSSVVSSHVAAAAAGSTTSLIHKDKKGAVSRSESQGQESEPSQTQANIAVPPDQDGHTVDKISKKSSVKAIKPRKASKKNHIRFDLGDEGDATHVLLRARFSQLEKGIKFPHPFHRDSSDGEIFKMQNMLVRVDKTPDRELPEEYDENGSQEVVSRTSEKWKQYMVVCRHSSRFEGAEFVVQLYKTRVIPALDNESNSKKPEMEIPLDKKLTRVNLYSSLDKTLVLWRPEGKHTKILILCTRSTASATEWYTFLRHILGWQRAQELPVFVPGIGITVRLSDPFSSLDTSGIIGMDSESEDEEATVRETLAKERAISKFIIQRCLEELKGYPEWSDIVGKWTSDERMGLAWRRYDRLEWIHGTSEQKMYGTIAMLQSHELELRPKEHYPTSAETRQGKTLEEPVPVEGFLIRLTSQRGSHKKLGRQFFKRLYFSTHDHYLIFSKPGNAQPPPPPRLPQKLTRMPSSKEIADQIPIIYAVHPYALDRHGRISWLRPNRGPGSDVGTRDKEALAEMMRKVDILKNCDGFIDLCQVVKVMDAESMPEPDAESSGTDLDDDAGELARLDSSRPVVGKAKSLELLLKNGLVVRLQAFDKDTKGEWITRLHALIRYWRYRHASDIQLYKTVRAANLSELGIDEEGEAYLGQFARKWELGKTYASPSLHHMCGISSCRAIHMSGPLYRKPRLHGVFTATHCILVPGALLIFEASVRTPSGRRVPHTHHERMQRLELGEIYLYSGLLTEGDLLYQNRTFDANAPGHHALPRMWPDDAWTSRDEDVMTCFVLWRPGGGKGWFREEREGKRGKLKRVSRLGTKGNRMVFRARSRAERDRWVLAIAAEIERCAEGGEDVRVTAK